MFLFTGNAAELPSGMTKNGAGTLGASGTWTVVQGWTADAAAYPGSTVSGNGLQAQSSSGAALVSAAVVFAGGMTTGNYQARLSIGTTVLATGAVVSGTSGTLTVSGTVVVNAGDVVTVEVVHNVASAWQATVSAGAATYVRIT